LLAAAMRAMPRGEPDMIEQTRDITTAAGATEPLFAVLSGAARFPRRFC
jgi:hypothetical protein